MEQPLTTLKEGLNILRARATNLSNQIAETTIHLNEVKAHINRVEKYLVERGVNPNAD